jgi:hypothetical protein
MGGHIKTGIRNSLRGDLMHIKVRIFLKILGVLLLTFPLLNLLVWGDAFYARPPYNIRFVWPSADWHFSLFDESETLRATLVKGTGKEEEAGLIIKAYPLGDFEDPDTLVLFHWMMEADYRSGVTDFKRLSSLYECVIGGEKGYREETAYDINGRGFLGSIVSFSKGPVFYQLIFMALSEVYGVVKGDFEEVLSQIEFFDSPHPLIRFVPSEILGIRMPILEATWPSKEELGLSLVTPKVVSYGADTSHTILLMILEEANTSAATERALTLGSEMRSAVEEWLGSVTWDQSTISLYGLSLQSWESVTTRMGNPYYVGFLTWSFSNKAYLLRIFGSSGGYSHNSLIEAAREVLSKANL